MSKPGTGRSLSGGLMKQFYQDHAEELLPVFIKKGLEEFCNRFCDLYASQPGQTGILVMPRQVSPTFLDYFADHQKFFKIAKSAYEFVGDGGMEEKDIQAFHDLIKESPQFTALTKSQNLDGKQRRIICRMMLSSKMNKSVEDSDIFIEMFAEDAKEEADQLILETSETEISVTTSVEVVKEATVSVRRGQKAKSQERALCIAVMHDLVKATTTSAQLADVKVGLVTQVILENHPELDEWVVENQKWIRHKHSVIVARHKSKVTVPDSEVVTVVKTAETSRSENNQPKEPRKSKARHSGKKAKSKERSQSLKVVNRLQGKNGKFYQRDEMIAKILEKYPDLEEWLKDKVNQNWLSTTLSSIRYKKLKTVGTAEAAPAVKPSKPVQKQEETPTTAPEVTSVGNDVLAQAMQLISDMRSGMVAPVEIIQRGRKLKAELEDFKAKLIETEEAFNEVFSSYEKLGIEV